jgi:hypothetical protein
LQEVKSLLQGFTNSLKTFEKEGKAVLSEKKADTSRKKAPAKREKALFNQKRQLSSSLLHLWIFWGFMREAQQTPGRRSSLFCVQYEPGAGSREPGAGSREPGAGSREPGAVFCHIVCRCYRHRTIVVFLENLSIIPKKQEKGTFGF